MFLSLESRINSMVFVLKFVDKEKSSFSSGPLRNGNTSNHGKIKLDSKFLWNWLDKNRDEIRNTYFVLHFFIEVLLEKFLYVCCLSLHFGSLFAGWLSSHILGCLLFYTFGIPV